MKLVRLGWVPVVLCLALTPSFALATQPNSSALANVSESTDQNGDRVWSGQMTQRLERIADLVDEMANSREDLFAGAALSADSKRIEIYATPSAEAPLRELQKQLGDDYSKFVEVHTVERSMKQLLSAMETATPGNDLPEGVTGIAPDVLNNGLTVALDPALTSSKKLQNRVIEGRVSPAGPEFDTKYIETMSRKTGVPIRYRFEEPTAETGTRLNDSPRFYGGAAITRGSNRCSIAFPVVFDGSKYVLTAGHCGNGTYKNPGSGKRVGSTYTTSWPGNAYKYGDWQLLSGSTYAMRLYSAGLYNSTSLPISRANTGSRAIGRELCSSGSTTGALCRYRIVENYAKRNVSGHTVYPITSTIHDPNRDGVGTCTGFKPGDSGGPGYYASTASPGYVEVMGLITSSNQNNVSNCKDARYSFTMFKGVLNWKSSVRVGQ